MARWFGPLIWTCCVCGVGCGFDRSPLKGDFVGSPVQGGAPHDNGNSNGSSGSGGSSTSTMHGGSGGNAAGSGGRPGVSTDSGVAMHDAAPPGTHDSGVMHSGSGGSTPGNAPDSGAPDTGHPGQTPDASIPGTYTPCNGNDDTTTCPNGWKCYAGQPNTPGHCAEACTQDSDCTDYDGFDFTCFTDEGKCRIDCGSSGSQGACPDELTCVLDLTNNYRCRFPPNNNGGGVSFSQPCDIAHGDSDCVSGLHCYRADASQVQGPGYCTTGCHPQGMGQGPECFNVNGGGGMGGGSLDLTCGDNVCRFECGGQGNSCPGGMDCEAIGNTGVCHYPLSQ